MNAPKVKMIQIPEDVFLAIKRQAEELEKRDAYIDRLINMLKECGDIKAAFDKFEKEEVGHVC